MFLTATADHAETRSSGCYDGEQTYLPKTMELDDLFKFIEAKLESAPVLPPDELAAQVSAAAS